MSLSRKFSSLFQQYTLAISRDVPSSFPNAITKFANASQAIDFTSAQTEHARYVTSLRNFVPTLCLPALDDLPDSVFVEDTVVTVGKKAVITNPGAPSRRAEVDSMKEIFLQLGMDVTDMREMDPQAFCDGGDVMFTGRHMFAGLTQRTNMSGVSILSKALGLDVIPVPFDYSALHLKSLVTHMDSRTLLAPIGDAGDSLLREMKTIERGYTTIRLKSELACNIVSVNGGILA